MPKKGENIYKRKDGRWEGRYIKSRSSTGKIVYGYVYAKTYREVKAKLRATTILHSVKAQPTIASVTNPHSFSTVAVNWFESIKLKIKESTQNKYLNMLTNYILPLCGEQILEGITYDYIESCCNMLLISGGKKGTGLSTKTVTDVLSIIRSILKFAIRKGMYVPCDGSTIQIKHTVKPMRVLSKAEQERLCEHLLSQPESCNIGVLVCLFTGLRVGEICALRWEDISFLEQTIYVRHTLQRVQDKSGNGAKTKIIMSTPKSSCSIRTIPIPEELSIILAAYKKSSHGYLL
ncbi:MAG: site-specific integrase, partial [bacterium]|nr:site-specific integrase [bacterium]